MLTMPAGHTHDELTLARALARYLGSHELHVFWSRAPVVAARPSERPLARAFAALGRLLGRL
jgi:hypothetical protein